MKSNSPTAATANESIIDWNQSLKLANNKRDLALDLLLILIEELPNALENIEQAMQEKNFRQLYQYAHKLHGASCYCGVPRLRAVVEELEENIKSSDINLLQKLVLRLKEEIEKVQTVFTQMNLEKL